MTFTEEQQRERWQTIMNTDFMSSEESGLEGDEDVFFIKPIAWSSDKVEELLDRLDEKIAGGKSSQSQRQAKKRVPATEYSTREQPKGPAWCFK